MALTRSLVVAKADEYAAEEPLYAVEVEQIETFGEAVARGEYGWRDLEWVVQWYYRRFLGEFPDRKRRAQEAAYGENDFEAVRDTVESAHAATEVGEALDSLTSLSGVDVSVASAFLMFLKPETYLVVGEPEWSALYEAGDIDTAAPTALTASDYEVYLQVCLDLGERFDCSMWRLYQALWRLWKDGSG